MKQKYIKTKISIFTLSLSDENNNPSICINKLFTTIWLH